MAGSEKSRQLRDVREIKKMCAICTSTIVFTSATARSPWTGASNPLTWRWTLFRGRYILRAVTDATPADGESFLSQKTGDRVGLVPFAEVTHDMLVLVHTVLTWPLTCRCLEGIALAINLVGCLPISYFEPHCIYVYGMGELRFSA